jgi:hypothetical protein
MKLIFTLAICLSVVVVSIAQVTFSEFPKDNALYPRDLIENTGDVRFRGAIDSNHIDSLLIEIRQGNESYGLLTFGQASFPNDTFNLAVPIFAGLEYYGFIVYAKNADSTWIVGTANNIVAGDIIMVQGQSNAQSAAYYGDANIWQNNYVRCFGNSNPDDFSNAQWFVAEGNGYFTPGAIGQWPLRMASLLAAKSNVPVAIINGADPGRPIEYFQRNDTFPEDPATNYGRLLQRVNNAQLAKHVRAILFYQGESDGDRADIHKSLFEALYADWVADYPNVEGFYVVQVREGCGAPSLQLRDYQRAFEGYLPKVKSLTANGIVGHDGCHYSVEGYEQLGTKMYKQVVRDLYGAGTVDELNVRVLDAKFNNETNTQIMLTTDGYGLVAEPGSGGDFKLLGAPTSIINISTYANIILLDLDQPVYDPNIAISYSGHAGNSNGWVLNDDGYGLFSFYNMPITNHMQLPNFDIPGIMSGPGNCLAFDGLDDLVYLGPVLEKSYTKEAWINWQGGGISNNIISGMANTAFWAPSLGNGYYLAAGHNGAWFTLVDPEPLTPNQWTHVAVTYDSKNKEMRLFKNGNLLNIAQDVSEHNDPELFIGAFGWGNNFQGKIDEVRIWDTVRSITNIRAHMCQKLQGNEPGLSAYFRLDQIDGSAAYNAVNEQEGQLFNFQTPGWQRSAAALGTKSTFTYQPENHLSLSLADGDSLVMTTGNIPEFAHLYATEEVPNVLQPADNHVLVDNTRYFGLFYPNQSIDSFTLAYHYMGNPLANVDEPRLSLLKRRNNAQPYWEKNDSVGLDIYYNIVFTTGKQMQEYILAIKENTVGTQQDALREGQVYPNPTNGPLYIKNWKVENLLVYDVFGEKCQELQEPASNINIGMLPPGIYLLEIKAVDGQVFKQKIVLLH